MSAKYVLGIDLGTTNCVLAYAPLDAQNPQGEQGTRVSQSTRGSQAQVEILQIPQLVAASTIESDNSLPSFLYLATEHEIASGAFDLPWASGQRYAVGQFARQQGADVPQRTVAAAKSWLCHRQVDRRQPILPPVLADSPPGEVEQISPVTAAQRYLEHLLTAWNTQFPQAPVAEQIVVLTVPASFDAAARELTREAALAAGLPADLVLLEEPQAAVYSWLGERGESWRKDLTEGDRLLVCDIGGGTTDLTLVDVAAEQGELELRRLAVGDHLLVGGDNMDLALAHQVAELFAQQGVQLDAWQSVALWHACRDAKEVLLGANAPDSHRVSVLGRGSKLIGGTVSVEVPRSMVTELLLNGFFPHCALTDKPQRNRASGFQELGLPFEADAAITRHLAAFLTSQPSESTAAAAPTHVLFNGGVFQAQQLRSHVLSLLGSWSDTSKKVCELPGHRDLDFAVARGAAYYGWSKQHGGVRIRGGTARSYYVGIETAGLAIPGAPRPLRALCVVPFGMEEGSEVNVPSGEIGLVLGEQATFRFFSSAVRHQDQAGDLLPASAINSPSNRNSESPEQQLFETDSLETVLAAKQPSGNEESNGNATGNTGEDRLSNPGQESQPLEETYVPVKFRSHITELGVFELWCVSTTSDRKWKLEFSIREEGQEGTAK